MLISIRATNGAGKSFLVKSILDQGNAQPIFGLLGPRRCEAYKCKLKDIKEPVYVLGPYHVASGGCDRIQPYEMIMTLIEKYAAKGHVLFEGVFVSSSYGQVGRLMEHWGQEAVMAFLSTSLEDCLKNVQKRRDARADVREFNPKNATSKYHSIVKSREKILAEGKVRVVDLDPNKGVETVLELLRGAK